MVKEKCQGGAIIIPDVNVMWYIHVNPLSL